MNRWINQSTRETNDPHDTARLDNLYARGHDDERGGAREGDEVGGAAPPQRLREQTPPRVGRERGRQVARAPGRALRRTREDGRLFEWFGVARALHHAQRRPREE